MRATSCAPVQPCADTGVRDTSCDGKRLTGHEEGDSKTERWPHAAGLGNLSCDRLGATCHAGCALDMGKVNTVNHPSRIAQKNLLHYSDDARCNN